MHAHEFTPAPGSTKRPKVVGRGIGSGHGKTSGRGTKGDKARGSVAASFEGGQTPLHRRLPQVRGFKPRHKIRYAVVNVADFDQFEAGAEVTPATLFEAGLLRSEHELVKVLGDGEIGKALTVRAHRFSASAIEKLQAAGGAVEVL